MKNRTIFWILGAVFLVSSALHFYRISYPAAPVFDEVHFATYAADYAQGKPSFDIHPPLGKLILAGALVASGYEPNERDSFVQIFPLRGGGFRAEPARDSFAGFPYLLLRAVSALFGAALPLFFYFFLRSVGLGTTTALLGAFFVAAENALLLQTRFIFLDGMYLAFALAALALYFSRPASSELRRGERVPTWAAGAVFGLALGVKLTAITFVGPIVADVFFGAKSERRVVRRRVGIFVSVAALVCTASFVLGSAFVPPQEQRALWNAYGVFEEAVPATEVGSRALAVLQNVGIQMLISLSGYLGGTESRDDDAERTSRWYEWPFMRKPMPYHIGDGQSGGGIVFSGNRVVWGLSVVAVFVALFSALVMFLRSARGKAMEIDRPKLLLGAGYLTSMLPFVFFVSRPTYPYHYLPALLFSIGLITWMLGRELGLAHGTPTAKQKRWLIAIALAVLAGFFLAAPTTYGI
jgi:dolichyl-phosphate-mannose--protein O-mannosyl transferase